MNLQLLVDLITGQLGTVEEQEKFSKVVRVIVAGDSLSSKTQQKDILNTVSLVNLYKKDRDAVSVIFSLRIFSALFPIIMCNSGCDNLLFSSLAINSAVIGMFFPYRHVGIIWSRRRHASFQIEWSTRRKKNKQKFLWLYTHTL